MRFVRERLIGARMALGLNQTDFAKKTGFSLRAIQKWEGGEGAPKPDSLRSLCTSIGRKPEEFLELEGFDSVPFKSEEVTEPPDSGRKPVEESPVMRDRSRISFPKVQKRIVPVLSWASAGQAHDYTDMANQIDEGVETECRDAHAFGLIIEGDSMEPRFQAGDVVVFSPSTEARNGDFVVARLFEGNGVFFKRYRRTGKNGLTIILESLNPLYEPKEFSEDAFRFVYPAMEFRGRLRI